MGEGGTAQSQPSGRAKVKLPTLNSTGSAALAAAAKTTSRTSNAKVALGIYNRPRQASQLRAINMCPDEEGCTPSGAHSISGLSVGSVIEGVMEGHYTRAPERRRRFRELRPRRV